MARASSRRSTTGTRSTSASRPPRRSPASRAGLALERADQLGRDPAAVEAARLRVGRARRRRSTPAGRRRTRGGSRSSPPRRTAARTTTRRARSAGRRPRRRSTCTRPSTRTASRRWRARSPRYRHRRAASRTWAGARSRGAGPPRECARSRGLPLHDDLALIGDEARRPRIVPDRLLPRPRRDRERRPRPPRPRPSLAPRARPHRLYTSSPSFMCSSIATAAADSCVRDD